MRTKELSRAQFLAWLADLEGPEAHPDQAPAPARDGPSITLAWPDYNVGDDPIVAVPARDLREFLAFASTYVGSYSPFTAFFRVMPIEMLEFLPTFRPVERSSAEARAFVGLAVADAALQGSSQFKTVADISVQACLATSSATVARAVSVGYDTQMCLLALSRWLTIRDTVGVSGVRNDPGDLSGFWSMLLPEIKSRPKEREPQASALVSEFFLAASEAGDLPKSIFSHLGPTSEHLSNMLRSNREDCVRALDDLHDIIYKTDLERSEAEIVLGFAASRVAEGSFSYLPLISRFSQRYPLATLWFGAFAALHEKTDALTTGNCLGRRVLRQLLPSSGGLNDVTADLSFEECLIYEREIRANKIRTDYNGQINIELLPGVSGVFRRQRNGAAPNAQEGGNLRPDVLRRAQRHAREIIALLGSPNSDEQPSLFNDDAADGASRKSAATPRKRNATKGSR